MAGTNTPANTQVTAVVKELGIIFSTSVIQTLILSRLAETLEAPIVLDEMVQELNLEFDRVLRALEGKAAKMKSISNIIVHYASERYTYLDSPCQS